MEIAARIRRDGFAFIKAYRPDLSTLDVTRHLGNQIALPDIPDVQRLVPKPLSKATPNSYSGNYGLGQFPLHTDLAHWARPPRYMLLRCVVGSPEVSTYVLNGKSILEAIGREPLRRTLVRPRRPLNGQRQLLRLLDSVGDGRSLIRWDFLYIRPAGDFSNTVYTEVVSWLRNATPEALSLVTPGDTLVIDNWRMLHGRSHITTHAQNRLVERMYLGDLH